VVDKFKKSRSCKNTMHLPVTSDSQGNVQKIEELSKVSFFKHFVSAVKENFRNMDYLGTERLILLLDNCRAHPPASELVCGNIFTTAM
jgi:hypothetical protein